MDDEDTNEEEEPSSPAGGQQSGGQSQEQDAPQSGGGLPQSGGGLPQSGGGATQSGGGATQPSAGVQPPSGGGAPPSAVAQPPGLGAQQPGGGNNLSMPGAGQGAGQMAPNAGAMNGGGGQMAAAALGAASRSLAQPFPQFNPAQLQQFAVQNRQGGGPGSFNSRPGRIDARPRNNIYMPGTGPGTGRTAIRVGTLNRDGSASPVSGMGAATGPLSQPSAQFSADELGQMAEQNLQGGGPGSFNSRPGRIDARPRNNIYMPGTGPGTGRTAIRVGTLNRDGSASPVSGMGTATGPLSQPQSRLFEQRQPTSDFVQQRQANVANAKADGSFDSIRDKFNSSNAGHYMDENGAISQRGAGGAPGAGQFVSAPDGQGGNKMVRLPDKPANVAKPAGAAPAPPAAAGASTPRPPLAAAGNAPRTSFTEGLLKGVPGAVKPGTATPGAPKPPLAAAANPTPPAAAPRPARKATFEGQSREEFFGAAAKRQKTDNKYAKWNGQ